MDTLLRNVRFSWRVLLKSPGFTFPVIVSLALGIGFNTAIFSVVNAVLLRPLPYRDSEQIVRIWGVNPEKGPDRMGISLPDFGDWQAQSQSFDSLAAATDWLPILTGVERPEELLGAIVSSNFFSLLGVQPGLGRLFGPQDANPEADPVVVLTDPFWKRKLGGDPSVIGKGITLDGKAYTVIGVLPAEFEDPKLDPKGAPQVWRPIRTALSDMPRSGRFAQALGRLKPGVSLERAQTELSAISRRLELTYPSDNAGWGVLIVPLRDQIIGNVRPALLILFGAVGLVLLIACANVANGLLVRYLARTREIAMRAALGARKSDIVSQLLIESLTLALPGGLAGILLAQWATKALVASGSINVPRLEQVRIDGTVLAFAVGLSVLTGIIFGLIPAFQAARPNLQQSLKEGGKGSGMSRHRLRSAIVVFAVALSLMLLVQAGLFIKSLFLLQRVDPGFEPQGVLSLKIPAFSSLSDRTQVQMFYDQVFEKLTALPGVESVGAVHLLPLAGGMSCDVFTIEGRPFPTENAPCAESRPSSPDYFKTMGISLLEGRPFTRADGMNGPQVAIINQTMARRFWPNESPLGKRITVHEVLREIVGVVGDVRHFSLESDPTPEIYVPQAQEPWDFMAGNQYVVLRTSVPPESLETAVRREIAAVNKEVPVSDVHPLSTILSQSTAQQRFRTLLFGAFAATALLLSAIGLYGVIAYAVSQRTHELGVRMALGARPQDILGLVMSQGMTLTLAGLVLGSIGAFLASRVVASLLFEVSAHDPVTFVGVILIFLVVSALAVYLPARHAARVDPVLALHYE